VGKRAGVGLSFTNSLELISIHALYLAITLIESIS